MLLRLKTLLGKFPALRSVKIYMFLLMLAMGVIPSFVMRIGILQSYEERAVSLRISDTQAQFSIIANHLLANNYLQDTSNAAINAELEQISTLYDGRVLIINNSFHVVKDTYGISEGKTIISEEVIRCFKGQNTTNYERKGGYIEMTIPIMDSVSSAAASADTARDGGYRRAGRAPCKRFHGKHPHHHGDHEPQRPDHRDRHGHLHLRHCRWHFLHPDPPLQPGHPGRQRDPGRLYGRARQREGLPGTEQIVDAFNQLLSRMKVIDDSRQEFVANVSHELKTPLTSMKVLADSLMQMEGAPIELYQEFMQDITAEIDRENKIINDLLSLVKMDKTAARLSIETVDINELIELVLKRLRPIARTRDIEVVFESIRPVTAEVDEVKITQVFTNLVENAIKYNKEHGWVKVLLDADHQSFTVEISDSGIGIPEADYDHIFERFYRVDKSHSRQIGGTGLGLAIDALSQSCTGDPSGSAA